jgi:acyl-CoA hydrolase
MHTEMVSDGLLRAIQEGVVTGARKDRHPGKVVATFAYGSHDLYSFVHENPWFEFHPVDCVNDPFLTSQNNRLVAINSAIEVDLTGQVCADSIGSTIYSGVGGQVDFIRADVHCVVTEYGVAHLWGRNLQERVRELVRIAHPDFRAGLEEAAFRLGRR